MTRVLPLIIGLLFIPGLRAQDYKPPRDIATLVARVQQFWTNMASSQRLKALDFVLSEKRELFVAGGNMPFLEPKVIGVDFTSDPNRALVRIAVKLLAKEAPGGYLSWTVTDAWVWARNNWYLDVQDARTENPFRTDLEKLAIPLDILNKDLDLILRFPQTAIDVGAVPRGERRKVSIPVQYTGATPISFEVKAPGNLLWTESDSSVLTAGSKEISVWLNSESWEGPFSLPVSLLMKYKGVTLERRLSLVGSVTVPVTFRQDPSPFKSGPGQALRLFVRNSTDKPVQIISVSTDDKFEIVELPPVIPPNSEGVILLSRKPDNAQPPERIYVRFAEPVNGLNLFTVPLRLSTSIP
jgi:hypothetical protein